MARRSSTKSGGAKRLTAALMHETMHRYKHGELHSGSSKGPIVAKRKQAIAIGLSVSARSVKKAKGNTRKLAALTGASTKRRLASTAAKAKAAPRKRARKR